ncbi:MAG: transcription-repair coupling factor, partial [Sphingomonadaceae bacterium]|nr:transcription-repair coupling factor [Sphingomonadaceae bacterium]
GNLLGDEQSGHIREIGFELYQQMLEDAILAARAESQGLRAPEEAFSPTIAVDAPILIPEDYVPDLNLRMALYRRMNELEDRRAIDGFAAELIDRFGTLPAEVKNLLLVIETKLNCRTACIAKLEAGAKGAIVTFQGDRFPNPRGLIDYINRLKGTAKLRPDQKMVVSRDWGGPDARLTGLLQLSRGLAKVAKGEEVKPSARAAPPAPPPPRKPIIGSYQSKRG